MSRSRPHRAAARPFGHALAGPAASRTPSRTPGGASGRTSGRTPAQALLVALALALVGTAAAQAPRTAEDVGAFFGGLMPAQLEALGIPGAVVAVVHDDEILFSGGYGHADVDAGTPVDPATTLFRIGSITKVFTYVAVMQLVEQDLVDLDADVNTYLDAPLVPEAYGRPVTLRDLMTHTAGFDERLAGLFATDPAALRPLSRLLAENLPPRVRPPGEVASYSNYGTALLGLVVEEVTNRPWDDVVQTEILDPLGIDHATARQPLPDALAGDAAIGYAPGPTGASPLPYTLVPLAPVGSIAASGEAMGRFLIALVGDGALGGVRILEPDTARTLREVLFRHDPRLPGIAHGLYESEFGGRRVLGHDGGMPAFISRALIAPDEDLGLFVSYSSPAGAAAVDTLAEAFMARYAPGPDMPGPDAAGPAAPATDAAFAPSAVELRDATGTYLPTRRSLEGPMAILGQVQALTVAADDDGTLTASFLGRPPLRLTPEAPGLWREVDTGVPWAFEVRDGRTLAFDGNVPVMAFEEVGAWRRPAIALSLVAAATLILISVLVAAPFGAVLHQRLGDARPRAARAGRAVLVAAAATLVAAVVGLVVAVATVGPLYLFGATGVVTFVRLATPVAAILTVVAAGYAVAGWVRPLWSRTGRVHYTLAVVAAAALTAWFASWNLMAVPFL